MYCKTIHGHHLILVTFKISIVVIKSWDNNCIQIIVPSYCNYILGVWIGTFKFWKPFKPEKRLFKCRIGYVFFSVCTVMTLCHSFLELKFCPCCLIYVLANELNFNDSTLESPYFASLHTRRQLMLFQPAVA